ATCQSGALAGTTSRWPCTSMAGLVRSWPSILATTLVRLGCDSRTAGSRPTSESPAATYSAAWRSPGPEWSPGLEVSILIRSRQMSTTSSCAVTLSAVTFLSLHWGGQGVRAGPARRRWGCLVAGRACCRGEGRESGIGGTTGTYGIAGARFTGLGTRLGAFGLL